MRVLTASVNPTAAQLAADKTYIGTLPSGARVLNAEYLVIGPMPCSFNIGTNCASALYGIISCTSSTAGALTKAVGMSGNPAGQSGFLNASISSNVVLAKAADTSGKKELGVYLKANATVSTAGSILLALYYVVD